jgi:hypothetical protein
MQQSGVDGIALRSGARLWPAPAAELLQTRAEEFGVVIRPCEWGKGAFATRELRRGTVLGAYGGRLLSGAQVDALYPRGDGAYVMRVGADAYRDAADASLGNWLRFVNSPHGTAARATASWSCAVASLRGNSY